MSARYESSFVGTLCIVLAVVCLFCSDAGIKWLSGDYAIHQIVFTRSVIAIPITLLIVVFFEGGLRRLRTDHPWLHVCRGLLIAAANMCFFLGLAAMPIADAMVLFFTAPLFITALSVPMLGEQVGWHRWGAVLVGLFGALVMLRPGSGLFQWASILPIIAALCYSLMQMLTRRLGGKDSAAVMSLYLHFGFIAVAVIVGAIFGDGRFHGTGDASLDFLFRAWRRPEPGAAIIMLFIGSYVSVGGYLITQAYRIAPASVIAPFEYTSLPLGVIFGYLLWNDVPDAISVTGMVLVVGSGLYVLLRESIRGRGVAAEASQAVSH